MDRQITPQDLHGDQAVDQKFMCVDCKEMFVWTVGEQRFYAERELSAPLRCAPCRRLRREHFTNRGQ